MTGRRAVLALLVTGALATGCGGEGGSPDAGPTAGSTSAPTGVTGALSSAECVKALSAMSAAAAAVPQAITGADASIRQSVDELDAFANAAPSEVRDDLRKISAGYQTFAQTMADSGFDPSSGQQPNAEVMAKLSAATVKLQTADFQAAVQRLNTWFETKCGK